MRGACDTHVHVYDHRFPVARDAVLRPPDASLDDYAAVQLDLGVERVVVVQPTTYGLDNRCQLEAVAALGDRGRAVVVIDNTVTDAELAALTEQGARGARFHLLPGGAVPVELLPEVAARISPFGWHVQVQLDGRRLPDLLDLLLALSIPLVVDHVGRFMPPVEPDDAAFRALLTLIDAGRCWVKLSAPYESVGDESHEYPAVARLVDELVGRAPERMLWASNWPHPGQANPPTSDDLAELCDRWLPTAALRRRVLVDNPADVYGFDPVPHHLQESS